MARASRCGTTIFAPLVTGDRDASAGGSGEAAVQRQLLEVEIDQETKYFDSRSGDEFKPVGDDVYVNHNGDAFWHDSTTHQYQTMFHTMWDPVTKKIFDMPVLGRYRERVTGQYYRYVNDHYVVEPMPNMQYSQPMPQSPNSSTGFHGNWQQSQMSSPFTQGYSTQNYLTQGYPTQDSMSMYSESTDYSQYHDPSHVESPQHTTTQTTRRSAPKSDDPMQARTWLSTEYSYVTLDAKGRRLALSILEGLVSGNKEMAWTFLETRSSRIRVMPCRATSRTHDREPASGCWDCDSRAPVG